MLWLLLMYNALEKISNKTVHKRNFEFFMIANIFNGNKSKMFVKRLHIANLLVGRNKDKRKY